MAFASAGDAACLGGPDVEQTASHADKVRTAKVVAFVSAGDAAGGDVDQTASHADKVRTAKVANRNSQPGGQGDNRKSHGRRLNSQPGGQGENRKSLGGRPKTVSPAAKTRTATRIKKNGVTSSSELSSVLPCREIYQRKIQELVFPPRSIPGSFGLSWDRVHATLRNTGVLLFVRVTLQSTSG